MYFGQSNQNDDDEYNFDVGKADNFKSKSFKSADHNPSTGHIAPFSPSPKQAKSISFSDQQAPKGNVTAAASSGSALDRAKSIMDKYSSKAQPVSNFKAKKASTFNEDDLSLSMEEEEETEASGMDNSDSYGVSDSYIDKPKAMERKPSTLQNISSAKAKAPSASAKPSAVSLQESLEEEQSGYSDEDFDNPEEMEESVAHDENTSYSRIGYEDDVEEAEEVESVAASEVASLSHSHSSRPKVLSFADFANQSSWEGSVEEVSYQPTEPEKAPAPAPIPVSATASAPAIATATTAVARAQTNAPSSSTFLATTSTVAVAQQQPQPAVSYNTTAAISKPLMSAAAPVTSAPIPQYAAPQMPAIEPVPAAAAGHTPYISHAPPPAAALAHDSQYQQQQQQQPQAAQPYPYSQPWGAPPHPYPTAAPPVAAAAPWYPPYGHPAPAAYPYAYPPMPPMGYHPYMPYPPASMPYGMGYMDPYMMGYSQQLPPPPPAAPSHSTASYRQSADAARMGPAASKMPPMRSSASSMYGSEPAVMELVRELNQAQDEANWAKKQLAEMIMKLSDRDSHRSAPTAASSSSAASNAKAALRKMPAAATADMQPEESTEEEEDSDEYSEDFEVSRLNASSPNVKPPAPVASKAAAYGQRDSDEDERPSKQHPSPQMRPVYSSTDPGRERRPQQRYAASAESHASYGPEHTYAMHSIQHQHQGYPVAPLDPFADSIARSFVASQELLRAKLDSLRMRIQMTDSLSADRRHLEDLYAQSGAGSNSAPSLTSLKGQFEARRLSNEQRLAQVLRESYPELQEEEIDQLMQQYQ